MGEPGVGDGRPLIAILDYGIGNLRSAQKGFERAGADALFWRPSRPTVRLPHGGDPVSGADASEQALYKATRWTNDEINESEFYFNAKSSLRELGRETQKRKV